ncbi:carboxypeptidase-like regulatory domain-containing protein [Leeuwenhoekiella polynyae]|uniref:Carboxypeptidase-like protein n=1 Tax=Leeuwenhoekiella polynyae TaxID=1550906 RepID=A0A4Q0PCG3_9FLAO|nr:TonB-dependent receptor [Leeuwenhoekiella polynyae]RXG24066.1 carboxypeptidase-like protein [Leeuwenhoekiella polynyae]
MKALPHYFFLLLCFGIAPALLAQTATLKGIAFDENNATLSDVNVSYADGGTLTDESGFYSLEIPTEHVITVRFTQLGFKTLEVKFSLQKNELFEFNPVLNTKIEQISEVVISSENRARIEGVINLDPKTVRKIPGANPGVENLLQSLPGVSSNNELSTQYAVRGGNYDENLVYINDIEVYRPFLIRSGQQEGLSIVNPDLVRDIDFSAGGFQVKYGDKLASVLDITYRRPVDFAASVDLSLLGVNFSAEGLSKNKKFTALVGARYWDNSLLVNAKQTETNYKPRFTDVQTFLTYTFNSKFELDFLGNIGVNRYSYQPQTRQTNFGTLADPIALIVVYDGQEEDKYETYFGAFSGTYKPNDHLNLKLIASSYHTQEQEHYDIDAQYALGTPSTNIDNASAGEVDFTRAIGSQLTHARNDLDALIVNLQHKGQYQKGNDQLDWGLIYTRESIRDRLQEYEIIDSAGFSIRPPLEGFTNQQPYAAFDAPLQPFSSRRAQNDVVIDRVSGYMQYSKRLNWNTSKAWYNLGIRSQLWTVSGQDIASKTQQVVSPRGQFSLKPNWKNTDMIFRLSAGMYHQPPFYRELRDMQGQVIPDVKAQQSIHLVAGNDWSFELWGRPFTLTSEAYYKSLSDVNTYTLENVRIRYRAKNDAEAYAYGLDLRLSGEFVPGTESWISLGILKTEENIQNRGYIARPTDQRFKLGFLFQDYVPTIPDLKLYLNMVYQSGLPGGSPNYADPYVYQTRLPFYFRADVGFAYTIINPKRALKNNSIFKELSAGLEIFNIFDRNNSITNTFVRDAATQQQYAVPNYLTPRVFNVKVSAQF